MIDWAAIENEYITTGIPQRDLAAKYGVSYRGLCGHCTKGNWVDKRKQYLAKISANIQQKSADGSADLFAGIEEKIVQAVCFLLDATITDAEQSRSAVERRVVIGNLKALAEVFTGARLLPFRLEEMQKRIRKLQAEAEALEGVAKVDSEIKIVFQNADWMAE